jgi:hypothetical protein
MRTPRTLKRHSVGITSAVLLSVSGITQAQPVDLEGNWLHMRAERPRVDLTPAGEEVAANYVPLRDDPDLRCEPASLTNVIGIPDPPWEIRLHDDYVEINFEYMDVKRRVPLSTTLTPENAPYTVPDFPHMGRSVGRYEGDTLVIETVDIEEGFADTLVQMYPQSNQMSTEERYRAEGDSLTVEITHTDPLYYFEPFTMRYEFFRVDLEVLEFGCTLETADYNLPGY